MKRAVGMLVLGLQLIIAWAVIVDVVGGKFFELSSLVVGLIAGAGGGIIGPYFFNRAFKFVAKPENK
jgi:hypothetical protein